MSLIGEINGWDQFQELVSGNSRNQMIVVEFYSDSCLPCIRFNGILNSWAEKYCNDDSNNNNRQMVSFWKLDIHKNEEIAKNAQIANLPTFHIFVGDKFVECWVGSEESHLQQLIENHLLTHSTKATNKDVDTPMKLNNQNLMIDKSLFGNHVNRMISMNVRKILELPRIEFKDEKEEFEGWKMLRHPFQPNQFIFIPRKLKYSVMSSIGESNDQTQKFGEFSSLNIQLFLLDLSTKQFSLIRTQGQSPRNYCGDCCIVGSFIVYFEALSMEVYFLNCADFVWRKVNFKNEEISKPKICHEGRIGFSVQPVANKIYLFGGGCNEKEDRFSNLTIFDLDSMMIIHSILSDNSLALSNHSCTFISNNEKDQFLFFFGGDKGGLWMEENNEPFIFDLIENQFKRPWKMGGTGEVVGGRIGHSALWIPSKRAILFAGGQHDFHAIDPFELLLFDLSSSLWARVKLDGDLPIPPQFGCSMLEFDNQSQLLIVPQSELFPTTIFQLSFL